MKVLVVNDSGLVGERLLEQLSGLDGIELLPQVFNAIQASHVLRSTPPDVVVLDPQLPAGTSLGVLKEVRAKAPGARVVVLASTADEVYRRAWLDSGADDCVTFAADLRALLKRFQRMERGCGDAT
jgi:two-component system NarL family response regulator